MAEHNDKGKQGEALAIRFLIDNDYHILETNWRLGHLEADIIARKDNYIVFVEVKTRSSDLYGSPEIFVDRRKQRSYIRLANAYILQNNRQEEARFDIITVILGLGQCKIEHIPHAFSTIG